MSTFTARRVIAALAAALAPCAMAASPQVVPSPLPPGYGDEVKLDLQNTWPPFVPATRYARAGNSIVVEYEYVSAGFNTGPQFAPRALSIGELPPGNYTVTARLFDINHDASAPTVVNTTIGVGPPDAWGIYNVPRDPQAFAPSDAVIRSAAYFDPGSMRTTVSGNSIRVDFDYDPSAPVGGAIPAGMSSFGSVRLPALAPGAYHLEGWGRPKTGGDAQKYFSRDFVVGSAVTIVEYYASGIDHYFITAAPDEIAQLDSGSAGWMRTGLSFKAWLRPSDAPPSAQPVCRFYSRGANSHFYTGDAGECQWLRSLEQSQRADATAKGQTFGGWQYEGIVFYALVPSNGQCPGGTAPVYRLYNNRAAELDPNHRFTADGPMRAAMQGWVDEGVAFCSPS
jgi:hypothetical protein